MKLSKVTTPMKTPLSLQVAVTATLACLFALSPARAGEPMTGAPGKGATTVVEVPQFQLQPIFTRHARIADKVTFSTTVRGSRNVELQEARDLEWWGVDAEIVFPFLERFQLRLNVPLYSDGHADLLPVPVTGKGGLRVMQKEGRIDLSGYGGVFDFASLQLEGQVLTEEKHGVNLTLSVGAAKITDPLQTDKVGRYNHAGEYYMIQVRADKRVNDWLTVVGHLGARHYYISDDLNPAGQDDGDVFTHYEAFVAGVFNPWNSKVFPVLELAYTGDLDQYNSILLVPEVIWALNSHFELKTAVPVGLTDDGGRVGFRLQATVRF